MNKNCAITGSSGYLGSRILNKLRDDGWNCISLTRNQSNSGPNTRFYSLEYEVPPTTLEGVNVLIHCAYDFNSLKRDDIHRINVAGSLELFEAAKKSRVSKIIYISSIAAYENSKSIYGSTKFEIEKIALQYNATIVRPGLIYGDKSGGMIGSLNSAICISPVLPLIGSGSWEMHLIHENDLCEIIKNLTLNSYSYMSNNRIITAASPTKFTFKRILKILSKKKNRRTLLIPIPSFIFWLALKVLEGLGIKISFRSDNIVSLLNPNPDIDFNLNPEYLKSTREFEKI